MNVWYVCIDTSREDVKVTVIGHSVGGTIVRTAALLDNHPVCAVRDMILLNSPLHRYTSICQLINIYIYISRIYAFLSFLFDDQSAPLSGYLERRLVCGSEQSMVEFSTQRESWVCLVSFSYSSTTSAKVRVIHFNSVIRAIAVVSCSRLEMPSMYI